MFTELNGKQSDVLEPFFVDPELEASIREISRKSGVSPRWVSKNVSELAEKGILKKEETNVSKKVSVGKKFTEIKRVYNLDRLQNSGLVSFLDEELRPDAVVVFGSYEEGEDREDSDIDIAVVNGREKQLNLERFENKLQRKINIQYMETAEEGDENFRNSLANGTVMKGYLNVV